LHRVYDNMLQRAQKCIDVQGDHFQHLLSPVSTLLLHLFNFLYRVRDLRPRWSTRRRAGFSCAILYIRAHLNATNGSSQCHVTLRTTFSIIITATALQSSVTNSILLALIRRKLIERVVYKVQRTI